MCLFIYFVSVEGQLYDKLVDGRNLARPAGNPWETIAVKVAFELYQIKELVGHQSYVHFSYCS